MHGKKNSMANSFGTKKKKAHTVVFMVMHSADEFH